VQDKTGAACSAQYTELTVHVQRSDCLCKVPFTMRATHAWFCNVYLLHSRSPFTIARVTVQGDQRTCMKRSVAMAAIGSQRCVPCIIFQQLFSGAGLVGVKCHALLRAGLMLWWCNSRCRRLWRPVSSSFDANI
jgi:hypothetical protein